MVIPMNMYAAHEFSRLSDPKCLPTNADDICILLTFSSKTIQKNKETTYQIHRKQSGYY
jgi:hypothetical protein